MKKIYITEDGFDKMNYYQTQSQAEVDFSVNKKI